MTSASCRCRRALGMRMRRSTCSLSMAPMHVGVCATCRALAGCGYVRSLPVVIWSGFYLFVVVVVVVTRPLTDGLIDSSVGGV